MKKFFALFVIGGIVLVGFAAFFIARQSEMAKKELEQALVSLRQKFAEAEAPLRSSGQPQEYARDQNELCKRYLAEVAKVAKQHPELLDVDHEKKVYLADDKHPLSPEQKKLRDEYFETTMAAYQVLTSGNYNPELTAFNNGVRLDVFSIKRVTTPEGENTLRADFIAWGLPNKVQFGDINMKGWVAKTAAPPEKGKGKAKAKAEEYSTDDLADEIKYKFDASQARPIIFIPNPERWVDSFPPSASVGYYYLQLFPRDTLKFDIAFHYQVTTESGRIVPVDVSFEHLTAADKVMMAPGSKLDAQEKESSDAERQGRPEDDPADAKPRAKK